MTTVDLKALLALAEKAAIEAGAKLRERPEGWRGIEALQGKDIKVKADRRAEDLIVALLEEGADIPILGEESGWHGRTSDSGLAWIVDPLDGSANFSRSIPLCAVSIALVDGDQPVIGVVYNFNSGEMFKGLVGEGAWLNDQPMKVSEVKSRDKAILMTGFPVRTDFSKEALTEMALGLAEWQKIRMIGSAAVAVAYVASGRADYYRENNIMFWDVAAGCALVRAAGGAVTISSGPLDEPKNVVAHNGFLNE